MVAATGALGLALLGKHPAFGKDAPARPARPAPYQAPRAVYRKNADGSGIVGPYGEVVVTRSGALMLPAVVRAPDGVAELQLARREPFLRIGDEHGRTSVRLDRRGITVGGKARAWSRESIRELLATLKKDRRLAGAAILLRAALLSAYPVAVREYSGKPGRATASLLARTSKSMGVQSVECTVETVTEQVVTHVEESVPIVLSAVEQWQRCYDAALQQSPCNRLPAGPKDEKGETIIPGARELCAGGLCVLSGFQDIVVGFLTVLVEVVEDVVRDVVTCTSGAIGALNSAWALVDRGLDASVSVLPPGARPVAAPAIAEARRLLGSADRLFGKFRCLLDGDWTVTPLKTGIRSSQGQELEIPNSIRVCIPAQCARDLTLPNVASEVAVVSAAAVLLLLAIVPSGSVAGTAAGGTVAVSGAAAALLGPVAVAAVEALAAVIVAAGPTVAAAAAIALCFLLVLLYQFTTVSAQLWFHEAYTTSFDDGRVCIEYPALAVAQVFVLTLGLAPAHLVPPIVTG